MKINRFLPATIALVLLAGCDSNPGGPTFPTVPAGSDLPPASNVPQLEKPPAKGAPILAPVETG